MVREHLSLSKMMRNMLSDCSITVVREFSSFLHNKSKSAHSVSVRKSLRSFGKSNPVAQHP
jgi:hypothetical protein